MAEFVKITGLDQTIKNLRALPRAISGKNGGPLRGALFAAGRVLKQETIQNAPVGVGTPSPGNLRDNIFLSRDRSPQKVGAAEHYVLSVRTGRKGLRRLRIGKGTRSLTGGDAWYWFWVEFGTSKQPPQSFMRNAFEAKKMAALDEFKRQMIRGVSLAAARVRKTGMTL
jgi:HK97 gp10 family phage protein